MDVLVLESERGAAAEVARELVGAGHRVVRCHEPEQAAFPCVALAGERCPLSASAVDVALTVRARAGSLPSIAEDGVACAMRARVPVVVAGSVAVNPYEALGAVSAGPHDDVVQVCEEVAARPQPEASALATAAAAETLHHAGLDHEVARAEARRRAGRWLVRLTVPAGTDRRTRDLAAVRITGALAAYDPAAAGTDVETVDAP